MNDNLQKIATWASHGTLKQFYNEASAKVSTLRGYSVELQGNTLRFYTTCKSGGFLGIGARRVKSPVLVLTRSGSEILVDADHVDAEFVERLAGQLTKH